VPFEFHQGSVIVRARANATNAELSFKLDTGFGVTTIHPDLVETLQLKRAGSLTIVGIAGKEQAGSFSGASFNFGGAIYAPRRVAVIPSDAERRRRNRDGILGASFFRRFVVEVDPTGHRMTLHEPGEFQYAGTGEIIPLEFPQDTPVVEASILFRNRPRVRARFEIDSGCDGALCLGSRHCGSRIAAEALRRNGRDRHMAVHGSRHHSAGGGGD